jgi:hypothetical protein
LIFNKIDDLSIIKGKRTFRKLVKGCEGCGGCGFVHVFIPAKEK